MDELMVETWAQVLQEPKSARLTKVLQKVFQIC